jgi:hypothetical protein
MKKLFPGSLCAIGVCALSSVLIFSSCRTLSTTAGAPSTGEINGMLYYLPIGKIIIKGEFKSDNSPTKTQLAGPPSSAPAGKGGEGAEPPQGAVIVSGGNLTITLVPEIEADESREYYVTPHANYIYEDDVRVTVNPKRLLSTGNVTTEDKTADIAGALASIAATAKGLAETKEAPPPSPTPTPPFYFAFHPSNSTEVEHVREALGNRNIYFDVTFVKNVEAGSKGIVVSSRQAHQLGEEGLIFRPGTSYKVQLRYPDAPEFDTENTFINTTQQFVLPATDRLYEIKYNRMAFVKKVKEIGFRDGMLTEFHQTVPSPILGFLGIPKAVLQAIVPIPGAAGPSGSASSSGTTGPH